MSAPGAANFAVGKQKEKNEKVQVRYGGDGDDKGVK
jgi:hypothetical protein